GESDALIVKGLVALMLRVANEQSAEAIMSTDFHFIDKIGLKEHLSPTRSNGLLAMIKQIKLYAVAFTKINNSN
ncbi:MAG: SufE family protein, partial [Prolixibacteraceae bacterium]|nr:SufE family protein [Prolixibacteraceae bacterium]